MVPILNQYINHNQVLLHILYMYLQNYMRVLLVDSLRKDLDNSRKHNFTQKVMIKP